MSAVIIPTKGQFDTPLASLWFEVPSSLQNAAADMVKAVISDTKYSERVRDLADYIYHDDSKYSSNLVVETDSTRYTLYRANGTYRFGAVGNGDDDDRAAIIAHLKAIANKAK